MQAPPSHKYLFNTTETKGIAPETTSSALRRVDIVKGSLETGVVGRCGASPTKPAPADLSAGRPALRLAIDLLVEPGLTVSKYKKPNEADRITFDATLLCQLSQDVLRKM